VSKEEIDLSEYRLLADRPELVPGLQISVEVAAEGVEAQPWLRI
jgi:hypothetical protein